MSYMPQGPGGKKPAQGDLFDADESQRRKREGMEAGAAARARPLELGRAIAYEYCKQHGEVHAEDVGRLLYDRHGIRTLGQATGSLFRGGLYVPTGEMHIATRKTSKGRLMQVWRFK